MQVFRAWASDEDTTYSPRLLLCLIEHLPPDSATAIAINGPDWRGWSRESFVLADIYDAINANTMATGNWRKRPPKIKPYPRPKSPHSKQSKQSSLAKWKAAFGGR